MMVMTEFTQSVDDLPGLCLKIGICHFLMSLLVVHVIENSIKRITSFFILLLLIIQIILESLMAWCRFLGGNQGQVWNLRSALHGISFARDMHNTSGLFSGWRQ